MSQENVEAVRKPLRVRERSSRTFDQRLTLRFPGLFAAYARLMARLPPGSRLRQAAARRAVRLGFEAFNRNDLDALLATYDPDFEFHPLREFVEAGLAERSYRGSDGYRKYVSSYAEVWGPDVRFEPLELIDTGDRVVMLTSMTARGQASGVPLTRKHAFVTTLKDGRAIRIQEYPNHDEALEAVGLSE